MVRKGHVGQPEILTADLTETQRMICRCFQAQDIVLDWTTGTNSIMGPRRLAEPGRARALSTGRRHTQGDSNQERKNVSRAQVTKVCCL